MNGCMGGRETDETNSSSLSACCGCCFAIHFCVFECVLLLSSVVSYILSSHLKRGTILLPPPKYSAAPTYTSACELMMSWYACDVGSLSIG